MGTQTNLVVMKDVAVDTDRELTHVYAVSSGEFIPEGTKLKTGENSIHLISPKPKLSKTLTNHEEQSISELFKVGQFKLPLFKI